MTLTTVEEAQPSCRPEEPVLISRSPSIGTMHGLLKSMVKGDEQKRLRLDLIRDIKKGTGTS